MAEYASTAGNYMIKLKSESKAVVGDKIVTIPGIMVRFTNGKYNTATERNAERAKEIESLLDGLLYGESGYSWRSKFWRVDEHKNIIDRVKEEGTKVKKEFDELEKRKKEIKKTKMNVGMVTVKAAGDDSGDRVKK